MRVALVSTYRPRACGIAVFSGDLRQALLEVDSSLDVDVVSIVRGGPATHPPEVVATIRQDLPSDYPAAAAELERRGTDVVLIEHEYGIFGGEAGEYVLSLTEKLRVPVVVTLHTVLTEPSPRQAATLTALCRRAALVMVFTETARQMVVAQGVVAADRVRVVPHGAPDILNAMAGARPGSGGLTSTAPELTGAAADLGLARLADRTVLSTFGLIGESKGLELMIRALPPVVAARPGVLFLIAGQTHPEIVKNEGESYRLGLERLVRDLGLTDHVAFVDRFLSVDELAVLLARTDLYVTPYRGFDQIVSGALTFAVAAGCPVVSTPYRYAENLLSSGAGVLVPFGDVDRLSVAVLDLLQGPGKLAAARTEARRVGADLSWSSVGKVTLEVLAEAITDIGAPAVPVRTAMTSSPQIRPGHLLRLVDDVGIVQHANGTVPTRSTGYCVDDVARLAIVALHLERAFDDPAYRRILATSLAFLFHAWEPGGPGMRNFMDYGRRWLDEPHTGDHVGRTVWALGEVVAFRPPHGEARACLRQLAAMTPAITAVDGPREVAFTLLGLTRPESGTLPGPLTGAVATLARRLADWFDASRHDGWEWFEPQLTYDNARLPQALIAAGRRLEDPELVRRGLTALDWYVEQCSVDGPAVRLVGNRWRAARPQPVEVDAPDEGDEQPVDAAALVEALVEARAVTGDDRYGRQAVRAFEWFLGRNTSRVTVYDFATGGCHDGLSSHGLNDNEGAESTLAFLQALLALEGAGLQGFVGRAG